MMKTTHPNAEWGIIWSYLRNFQILKLMKLFILLSGSILCPFMGFFLLLLQNFDKEPNVSFVGSEFHNRNMESKEVWLQVNGVCTDRDVQTSLGKLIAEMFHREVILFWNPTQGMLFDLIECMMGRTFNGMTYIGVQLADVLEGELLRPEITKLVLIVHSQGAIIASNAISVLLKRNVKDICKLEVYTFGSAADSFAETTAVNPLNGEKQMVPYYEHFANDGDVIAKIGVLHWMFTKYSGSRYRYPGRLFVSSQKGHLLGEHYLNHLKTRHYLPTVSQDCASVQQFQQPKLYSYLPHFPLILKT